MVTHLLEAAAANGTSVSVATHRHTFAASRILRLPSAKVMTNGARRATVNGQGHANGNGQVNGNGHANATGHANGNGASPRTPLWRLVVPARPRLHKKPLVPRLPLWRRAAAFTANGYRLVMLNGLRSWSRDVRLTTPVIGTIALLLLLCRTLALAGGGLRPLRADPTNPAPPVRASLP